VGGGLMTKIIRFKGLCCANCAAKLEKKLNKIKGVEATLSFVAGKILLELDNEDLIDDVLLCCKKEYPDMVITL
jgi:Cd2+/Zn2+-exporting ATPase